MSGSFLSLNFNLKSEITVINEHFILCDFKIHCLIFPFGWLFLSVHHFGTLTAIWKIFIH